MALRSVAGRAAVVFRLRCATSSLAFSSHSPFSTAGLYIFVSSSSSSSSSSFCCSSSFFVVLFCSLVLFFFVDFYCVSSCGFFRDLVFHSIVSAPSLLLLIHAEWWRYSCTGRFEVRQDSRMGESGR